MIIVLLTLYSWGHGWNFRLCHEGGDPSCSKYRSGAELEWMGRSGIEVAKWILVQQETRFRVNVATSPSINSLGWWTGPS